MKIKFIKNFRPFWKNDVVELPSKSARYFLVKKVAVKMSDGPDEPVKEEPKIEEPVDFEKGKQEAAKAVEEEIKKSSEKYSPKKYTRKTTKK